MEMRRGRSALATIYLDISKNRIVNLCEEVFNVKRLALMPAQVLATDELVPNDGLPFKIYYRIFREGAGNCLPPIIVGNQIGRRMEESFGQGYERWQREEAGLVETRRREYGILFQRLRETPYYILDGNHRALAAALNRRELTALQLDSDQDLSELDRMVTTGELFSFPHNAETVEESEALFIQRALNLNRIPPNHSLQASHNLTLKRLITVETRAYELCSHRGRFDRVS
jgi:hypothetical protein